MQEAFHPVSAESSSQRYLLHRLDCCICFRDADLGADKVWYKLRYHLVCVRIQRSKVEHIADRHRTGFWVFFWTVLEYDLGLICTSAPTLRALFKRQLPSQMSRSMSRATGRSFHDGGGNENGASSSTTAPATSPADPAATYYRGGQSSKAKSSWDVAQDEDFKSLRTMRSEDERPIFGSRQDFAQEFEQISLHIIESARGSWRMGRRSPRM